MESERSVRYFLGAMFLLALAAVGMYFWRQQSLTYRLEDTPQAVVFNYVLAVQRGDAPMLAALMVQDEGYPTVDEIRDALFNGRVSVQGYSVRLGDVSVAGDRAWVQIEFWVTGDSPGDGYSYEESALLVRQGGRWKVAQMPSMLWDWDWGSSEEVMP